MPFKVQVQAYDGSTTADSAIVETNYPPDVEPPPVPEPAFNTSSPAKYNVKARSESRVRTTLRIPYLRGVTDHAFAYGELETFARGVVGRIDELERFVTGGIASPVIVTAGEEGLTPGRLIHVRDDGVAFLARNTDANRACTHVIMSRSPRGGIVAFGYGHHPIVCLPFTNDTAFMPLWLSNIPGHAQDSEPDDAEVVQIVGHRYTGRDLSSGLCSCVFKPEFTGLIHSSRFPSGIFTEYRHCSYVGIPEGIGQIIGRFKVRARGRSTRTLTRVSVMSGSAVGGGFSSFLGICDSAGTTNYHVAAIPDEDLDFSEETSVAIDTSAGDVEITVVAGPKQTPMLYYSWGGNHANLSIELEIV